MKELTNDWYEHLATEFQQPYFQKLRMFLKKEYQENTICPPIHDIYNALNLTSYTETKVVILGQDPYHGIGQAHGLSFSVKPNVKVPPSLQNIFKELRDDVQCEITKNGNLVPWARQGILLLNTVLTVRTSEPASHKGIGWEQFTDRVIDVLNEREHPVIFVLWGRHAQVKSKRITQAHHHLISAPHPSPLSANRGFFGSRPFSKINDILTERGEEPINWQLPVT